MLLHFSYRCVSWTWAQAWYRYIFDDVNLINRLLLSSPLIYCTLALLWGENVMFFQNIMQVPHLSSPVKNKNWLIISFANEFSIECSHLGFHQSKVCICLHKHVYWIAWPQKHMFRHQCCLRKCISSKDMGVYKFWDFEGWPFWQVHRNTFLIAGSLWAFLWLVGLTKWAK